MIFPFMLPLFITESHSTTPQEVLRRHFDLMNPRTLVDSHPVPLEYYLPRTPASHGPFKTSICLRFEDSIKCHFSIDSHRRHQQDARKTVRKWALETREVRKYNNFFPLLVPMSSPSFFSRFFSSQTFEKASLPPVRFRSHTALAFLGIYPDMPSLQDPSFPRPPQCVPEIFFGPLTFSFNIPPGDPLTTPYLWPISVSTFGFSDISGLHSPELENELEGLKTAAWPSAKRLLEQENWLVRVTEKTEFMEIFPRLYAKYLEILHPTLESRTKCDQIVELQAQHKYDDVNHVHLMLITHRLPDNSSLYERRLLMLLDPDHHFVGRSELHNWFLKLEQARAAALGIPEVTPISPWLLFSDPALPTPPPPSSDFPHHSIFYLRKKPYGMQPMRAVSPVGRGEILYLLTPLDPVTWQASSGNRLVLVPEREYPIGPC